MEEYNKLKNSSIILEDSELIRELYNNRKDRYSEQKIELLRNNLCEYYFGLDKENRIKYIQLAKLNVEEQERYEKFLRYGDNVDTVELIKNFFDGNYNLKGKKEEQMINIRRNITAFWRSLKKEEKEKYINLVNEYYN